MTHRLGRRQIAYLKHVAAFPHGMSCRPSEWREPLFQGLYARGLVSYHRSSNRYRTVSITDLGRAAISEHRSHA